MGTPEFAVPCLDSLLKAGYNVVGVITAPDRPAGRGKKIRFSAVKEFALNNKLNILQPTNLKNLDFQKTLKNLNADIQVVVAFRMLPEAVWNMPPMGSINLHASLLPNYRGAAPINWAIINGEKETGVSTFFLQHEIDTGKIIFQEKIEIKKDDYLDTIYDKLMNLGAKLIVKTIDAVNKNDYPQTAQDHITDIKHAPKIFKETGEINWNNDVISIYNLIRGLSPYPVAWTKLKNKTLKIFKANPIIISSNKENGEVEFLKETIKFYCKDGYIEITELQLEGKRKMKTSDFLKGYKN